MRLLALIFSLVSLNAFAVSEGTYQLEYVQKVKPLIEHMSQGTFNGAGDIKINYRTYLQRNAENCLVILPGRTEPVEKYAETIYDLLQTPAGKNMDFYLMDHRGQGHSGRLASPSDLGHVDSFDNYVSDVKTFVTSMRLNEKCSKKFLLAHSMGAGIAVGFLLENPKFFDAVALSSPMLKILTAPYSYAVAKAIVESQMALGKGKQFAKGQKGFNENQTFEENKFTTSPERFVMTIGLFKSVPETKVGGVSNRWLHEIMKGTSKIRSHYHEVSMPVHLFTAGDELYSDRDEMIKFCNEAANCKRTHLAESKHEVLNDKDKNRNIVLKDLAEFFN